MRQFKWIEWNLEKIGAHVLSAEVVGASFDRVFRLEELGAAFGRNQSRLTPSPTDWAFLRTRGPLGTAVKRAIRPIHAWALKSSTVPLFFYAGDGDKPTHVHVARDDSEAKVWLDPIRLERSGGVSAKELRRIEQCVTDHREQLMDSWNDFFNG